MVFNFRIVSDEQPNFRREIEIDADATFYDFKNAICDSVNYDRNLMSSFFICSDNWEKEKEITLEDMGDDSDREIFMMEDSVLSDFIEDEGQRLMFTFDYMTDRSFFIEMKEIITRKDLKDPVCTLSRGIAPAQTMDFEEFDKTVSTPQTNIQDDAQYDIDESFYGSDDFNEDEMDEESFGELEFDN